MRVASMLLLSWAVLMPGCHTAAPEAGGTNAMKSAPWHVSLQSSGGIAGRGNGSIELDSTGAGTAATMSRSVPFTATADELRRVNEALAVASRETWKSPPTPQGGADMFEWVLTVESGGEKKTISWREDNRPLLPRGIAALVDVLDHIRARAAQ